MEVEMQEDRVEGWCDLYLVITPSKKCRRREPLYLGERFLGEGSSRRYYG